MEYTEAVSYLDQHIGQGGEPGLERITDLLEMMGRPDEGYPIVHVAGTNGKTSVSRMTTLILVAHGLTTGTYTSPHLQKVEERLAVNGRYATEDEFALAIRGEATIEVGIDAAIRALAIVRAALESSQQDGRAVAIKPLLEGVGVS